jgi:hypothetical protein
MLISINISKVTPYYNDSKYIRSLSLVLSIKSYEPEKICLVFKKKGEGVGHQFKIYINIQMKKKRHKKMATENKRKNKEEKRKITKNKEEQKKKQQENTYDFHRCQTCQTFLLKPYNLTSSDISPLLPVDGSKFLFPLHSFVQHSFEFSPFHQVILLNTSISLCLLLFDFVAVSDLYRSVLGLC